LGLKVTILGSGCSFGTPKPGCKCRTCEWARENGFERKRFSCLIESNGKKVLIDAGPDLRSQMLDNNFSTIDLEAVIITHEHYDHYAGLGEFRSFNKQMPCYCLPETARKLKPEFDHLIPDFLLLNEKEFGKQFKVAGFKATLFDSNHGSGPCAGIVLEAEGKKVIFLPDSHLNLPKASEDCER
jgi:phosphoribosyl 1,2-cyclic phosphate phosphodiesterase